MKYYFLFFLLICHSACLANSAENNKSDFTINVAAFTENKAQSNLGQLLFESIYRPLDINVKFVSLPRDRAFKMLNEGDLSGEAARIKFAFDDFENVERVNTPILEIKNYLYCIKPEMCNFKKKTLISIIKSSMQTEIYCKQNSLTCIGVNNEHSALKSLVVGYADTLLANEYSVNITICEAKIAKVYRRLVPEMTVNLYHFVNKRYANIVPDIENQIHLLKTNGSVNKLIKKTELHHNCQVKIIDL
ncbi:hypothetical protein [Pseudoalteromonas denitrificans]|nr:hypothetical protein [Pseudoalteromonas denitrificans]